MTFSHLYLSEPMSPGGSSPPTSLPSAPFLPPLRLVSSSSPVEPLSLRGAGRPPRFSLTAMPSTVLTCMYDVVYLPPPSSYNNYTPTLIVNRKLIISSAHNGRSRPGLCYSASVCKDDHEVGFLVFHFLILVWTTFSL